MVPLNLGRIWLALADRHAAVRCQPSAIKGGSYFLAATHWESKTNNAIIDYGRRGTFCPVSEGGVSIHYLHQINKLS